MFNATIIVSSLVAKSRKVAADVLGCSLMRLSHAIWLSFAAPVKRRHIPAAHKLRWSLDFRDIQLVATEMYAWWLPRKEGLLDRLRGAIIEEVHSSQRAPPLVKALLRALDRVTLFTLFARQYDSLESREYWHRRGEGDRQPSACLLHKVMSGKSQI